MHGNDWNIEKAEAKQVKDNKTGWCLQQRVGRGLERQFGTRIMPVSYTRLAHLYLRGIKGRKYS